MVLTLTMKLITTQLTLTPKFDMASMLSEVFGGYKDAGTFSNHGKVTSSTTVTTPVNGDTHA